MLGPASGRPSAAGGFAGLLGRCRAGRRGVGRWSSPGSARSAAPRAADASVPFCDDCRAELLEAAGPACPRCAMPVGPCADLAGGCSRVPGAVARVRRGGRARAVPGADPRPLPEAEARAERLDRPLAGRRAGRGAARALGEAGARPVRWVVPVPLALAEAAGDGGTTRPRSWPEGWPGGSGCRPADLLRRVAATPILARAGPGRAGEAAQRRLPGPAPAAGLKGRTVLLVDDILTTARPAGRRPGP